MPSFSLSLLRRSRWRGRYFLSVMAKPSTLWLPWVILSPAGGGTFSGFDQNVSTDGGEVAFSASGSGFSGLYGSGQSGLCRVIDTNDTLAGREVTQLFMGRDSYSLGILGFRAVFSGGSEEIYLGNSPRSSPTGALFIHSIGPMRKSMHRLSKWPTAAFV